MSQLQQLRVIDINCVETNARAKLDREAIVEYSERLEAGSPLPPLDVYFDGDQYWLAEGQHRMVVANHAEQERVECRVHQGTKRDALLHAISGRGNREHGVRRTNADKRRAVELAFADDEWGKLSDRAIAEICGVDDHTVAAVRRERLRKSAPEPDSTPAKRVGRDGKKQAGAKKKPAPSPQPPGPNGVAPNSVAPGDEPLADDDTDFDPAAIEAASHPTVDIKGLATPYKAAIRTLNALREEFKALAAEERTGVHLVDKITRIVHDVNQVVGTISQAEPVCVCEGCDGKGCRACYQSGFWTRAIKGSRKK